jgi:predicted GIY-YIG superfamily endonuclease
MRCKGGALTLGVTQFLHVRVDEHRLDEPTEGLFPEAGIDPWMALGAT